MGGVLSIESAVELASREVDEKLKSVNAMVIGLMNLASGHSDEKLQLVDAVVDRQRGKLLSSATAFMYFTLLMSYTLYSRPSLETKENLFLALQFVILGVWIADLVALIRSGTNRDGYFILALMILSAGFVFCRGRTNKERKK
ncbi:hypothetical protein EV426DRAFT_584634 [Tirmania nivea]|nr:hypothetical protein EV426DRAFT_584634 [Tirmania nivea]